MEVLIPRGDGYHIATVAHIKRNVHGELIGIRISNPIFDTRLYETVLPGVEGVGVSENRVT